MKHTLLTRSWMTHAVRPVAALVALCVALPALGQLTPARLYYGIDRTIPMTVEAPEGSEVEIRLLSPVSAETVASAPAMAGGVDLAGLFPRLWSETDPTLLYAQLYVDGEATGPAVVLDPMVTVDRAKLSDPTTLNPTTDPRRGVPIFDSDRAQMSGQSLPSTVYSGLRAYVDKDVMIETSAGLIRVRLRPDEAPNSAYNFRQLVEGGFYTEIIFHRIIPAVGGRPGFVIQVGDPTGTGRGGPGYHIDLEKSSIPHDFGVLSMARSGDPDSGGSQVFICLSREQTASLDGRYTAFGQAIEGADTIAALGSVQVQGDRPTDPPVLKRAYLVDAAPHGRGAAPVTRPRREPEPWDR